ncbi:MAG: hypothetical protein IT211_01060 [Armatimonadetes bacterium]|nr:hypothetical protein [Armatimonadota bacterium]
MNRWLILLVALLLGSWQGAVAQTELLPVDHPATRTLIRANQFGAIPGFPREHLPISRRDALAFLEAVVADTTLPASIRQSAAYHVGSIGTDQGETPVAVLFRTGSDSPSRLIVDDLFSDLPLAYFEFRDTAHGVRVIAEPVFSGQLRTAPNDGLQSFILQGGARLRGTLLDYVGFGARLTNGTITGDTLLALRDPRLKRAGKFGVIGQGRDVDFSSGHLRVQFGGLAAELGREPVQLGGGLEESLLLGSLLPSNFDYLRLTAQFGRFAFSHIHAALLADATLENGTLPFGPFAEIPPKYVAAHLLSFGPFAGLRGSLGESVIYSGRPFELGYLNPFNFLKSQEHYLRDRDNSFMYASLSANPFDGVFLEGEFMLDDLIFGNIGTNYWGNKTAWRVGGKAVAFPIDQSDISVSYTRIEPYTYTHFDSIGAYIHDAAPLAAGGLEPNSYMIEGKVDLVILPNLTATITAAYGEHGANIVADTGLVRNVGGDIRQGFRGGSRDSYEVTFLDGDLQKSTRFRVQLEYEILRNVHIHLTGFRNATTRNQPATQAEDLQGWIGVRIE